MIKFNYVRETQLFEIIKYLYKWHQLYKYMMHNKLIHSGSLTLMLLLLLTFVGSMSSVYAQGNLNISESQIVNLEGSLAQDSNITTKEIISSIITPWNTGNK